MEGGVPNSTAPPKGKGAANILERGSWCVSVYMGNHNSCHYHGMLQLFCIDAFKIANGMGGKLRRLARAARSRRLSVERREKVWGGVGVAC